MIADRPEDNESLAHATVQHVAQQMSFPHGRVRIDGGFMTAIRRPLMKKPRSGPGPIC